MIKIGVDGRLLQGKLTGVGKFVLNLLEYICANDTRFSISVYTNKPLECAFRSERIRVFVDSPVYAKVKPMVWSKFLLHRLLNHDQPDIFFAGDALVPLFIRKCKIVSLVHDFNQMIAPETMSTLRLISDKLFYKKDIFKADLILANSGGTADKLNHYFGKKADLVVFPLLDPWYRPVDKDLARQRLAERQITYPYILTVATQEPRKNLDKTIRAFIALKRNGELRNYKLLLVGSKGWKSNSVQDLINQHKEDVLSPGYIEDELMPFLYAGADVFVFPSLYEGFGMPVREALLCGTRVVTSDIPELREASFNLAEYIDPNDELMLQTAIKKTLDHPSGPVIDELQKKKGDQLDRLIPALVYMMN